MAFHTFFNTLGVLTVLPFAGRFAALIERLVPERPAPFTERLDRRLFEDPALAIEAVRPTLRELVAKMLALLLDLLERGALDEAGRRRLALVELATSDTRRYVERIPSSPAAPSLRERRVSALHVIDHLRRLADRCATPERAAALRADTALMDLTPRVTTPLREACLELDGDRDPPERRMHAQAERLYEARRTHRTRVLSDAVGGSLTSDAALDALDAYRWLERVTYHSWRILHHLARLGADAPPPAPDELPPHVE